MNRSGKKRSKPSCKLKEVECPEHTISKDSNNDETKRRKRRQDKLTAKELQQRIEKTISQDPEKALKAAKIIELWLMQEKADKKQKKAG